MEAVAIQAFRYCPALLYGVPTRPMSYALPTAASNQSNHSIIVRIVNYSQTLVNSCQFQYRSYPWLPVMLPSCYRARMLSRSSPSLCAKFRARAAMAKGEKKRAVNHERDVVTRDYTINLHKRLHGVYAPTHYRFFFSFFYGFEEMVGLHCIQ